LKAADQLARGSFHQPAVGQFQQVIGLPAAPEFIATEFAFLLGLW
jgi:hypothetical protein